MEKIYSIDDLKNFGICANSSISENELINAKNILFGIYQKTKDGILKGKGPFFAEIYDENKNLIASAPNSVAEENCAICHAEINALKIAHQKFRAYDLSPFNLSIYINAEPCIMCAGAIMWAGIKKVFYGVTSDDVEKITGFDEGFKPFWHEEFKKRNIEVFGKIEDKIGIEILKEYVKTDKEIYMPKR